MKLVERKNTTQKGLEQLRELLSSFKFSEDIKVVESEKSFFCRLDTCPADRYRIENADCYFSIKNGELIIKAYLEEYDYCHELPITTTIKRINFADCMLSFFELIELYNNAVQEKEKEIKALLDFVEGWKKELKE